MLGLLSIFGGCSRARPLHLDLARDVQRPQHSVVIFFVDGMDRTRLGELLDQGHLPNIERRFVEGGVAVAHAVASLPPITYANTVSFLTGCFPGHHGILGNRWFDRHTLEYRDYGSATTFRTVNGHFRQATLYELLPDHFTVSNQCHTFRGATYAVDSRNRSRVDWLIVNYIGVDRRVALLVERVGAVANRVKRWPSVLLNYFPGVDEIGHRRGSASARYRESLVNADAQIGRIMNALDAAGLARDTLFVLFSDHGHVTLDRNRVIEAADWLSRRGLRVHAGPVAGSDYAARYRRLEPFEAVVVAGAPRRLAIHLRGAADWSERPTRDVVRRILQPLDSARGGDALEQLPGVALVCAREGPDRLRILSRNGGALVGRRVRAGTSEYRLEYLQENSEAPEPASDPLGYRHPAERAAFVESGWHGSREWLDRTAATRFPDFVPQIVEMFDSPRAGDVVAFAADDWGFEEGHAGGHGSALACDMLIPLYFAGPGLARGATLDAARAVDVLPTLLEFLGELDRLERSGPIDGVSLWPALRSAKGGSR